MKRYLTLIAILLPAAAAIGQAGPFVVHTDSGVSTHNTFLEAYYELNPAPQVRDWHPRPMAEASREARLKPACTRKAASPPAKAGGNGRAG